LRGENPRAILSKMRKALALGLVASLLVAGQVRAQNELPPILRDAEIESDLRTFAGPAYRAAGLDPASLNIYLVDDSTLNSFVTSGQYLFMNTGTLMRAETPNQLVGIMAHETGHIAGGHVARSEQGMRNAEYEGLAAMAIGMVLTLATAGLAAPALLGAQGVAQRAWLEYSTEQEARADQAAMRFLDRSRQSARGLLQFFVILQQTEMASGQAEVPYLRTHPLTSQRVDYVREHVERSSYSDVPDPPEWVAMLARIKAKLAGFLQTPQQTLNQFPESDQSLNARYARAIAYYRIPDLDHAVPAIDALIRDYPNDPYFQELKGQMLFENGRVAEAVAPYRAAVKLDPSSNLLKTEMSQVILESGDDPKQVAAAQLTLEEVVRAEVQNPEAWRLLAIAYGKSNNMGMMALALAEQGASAGNYDMATGQAEHAMKLLPPGPSRQRAQDIADEAKREKDKDK
jgi:predicted Zn-dependent protease